MNRTSPRPTRPLALLMAALVAPSLLAAQRGTKTIGLRPPIVSVSATPLAATVVWRPVTGAIAYTVEWATTPLGPWTNVPVDPRAGSQVTMPSSGGLTFDGMGGALYYYRVTAVPELGEPGVTVVPRVTPQLDPPTGVHVRQEGSDAVVTWVPVPYATGYQVSVAPGQQSPPIQSVEASPQQTEARLLNLVQAGGQSTVWVAVRARYGASGAISSPASGGFGLMDPQRCWPASAVPGPAPTVLATATGPTMVRLTTALAQTGVTSIRAERAVQGSQVWQGAGCSYGEINDWNLEPGTLFEYRVTELHQSGTVGQTVVTVATPAAPDSPAVTAMIGACAKGGCPVTLTWSAITRAIEYRIESSYGLFRAATGQGGGGFSPGQPIAVPIGIVPSGVHTFVVTPLFRVLRPSPRPPSVVTVTVP